MFTAKTCEIDVETRRRRGFKKREEERRIERTKNTKKVFVEGGQGTKLLPIVVN